MNHCWLRAVIPTIAFLFILGGNAFSQGTYIDVKAKNPGTTLYEADSHFLGESFVYTDPNKPIVVWLRGNKAGWTGQLSFVKKLPNGTTLTIPLMRNKDAVGTTVNVTNLVQAQGQTINTGDEIYFMYVNVTCGCQAADWHPKYTGENIAGDDDFVTIPVNVSTGAYAFAVAGRTNADSVEFGFEDQANAGSDFDYSDIVFGVSGLSLFRELQLPPVIFNPQSTSFPLNQAVSLTGAPNTNIFYRFDDTGPWLSYTGVLTVDKTTKISAFQTSGTVGFLSSDTTFEVYTHAPQAPTLKITKINGEDLSLPGKFLTELDNQFKIELTVYYAPTILSEVDLTIVTGSDADVIKVSNPTILNNSAVFSVTVPLDVGTTGTNNDGRVATKYYDQGAVGWTNPLNTAQKLSQFFNVQPSAKNATLNFVTDATAANLLVGDIAANTTNLYVLLVDQVIDSSKIDQYKIKFTNLPGVANANTSDSVVVGITELSPGRYVAQVPLAVGGPQLTDNILQAIVGDQIQAVFVDPNYPADIAITQKGFGVPTQKPGRIFFVDKSGNEILRSDTTFWDLNEDSLYLRYIDDPGNGWSKNLIMYVNNSAAGKSYGLDTGVFVMEFKGDSVWETGVPIQDSKTMNLTNNILDIYFHGLVTAKIFTHRNNISAESQDAGFVTATINVSYPEDSTFITIRDPVRDSIDRVSTVIEVCVTDQVFSKVQVDTIILDELSCKNSGDKEESIALIQTSVTSNKYCATVPKTEGSPGVAGDGTITCDVEDLIHVEYENPITDKVTEKDTSWDYGVVTRVEILTPEGNQIVSQIPEAAGGNNFLVRLTGYDSSISNTNETRLVRVKVVSSVGGTEDYIWVTVTEKGKDASGAAIFEGTFKAEMDVTASLQTDTRLVALISTDSLYNIAGLQASYDDPNDGEPERLSQPEIIRSAYIKAKNAIILDNDVDGMPDQIKIKYEKIEFIKPASIPGINWPGDGSVPVQQVIDPSNITIVAPSDTITIDITDNPAFDTIITDLTADAKITLPGDIYFRGTVIPMYDRISPVVVSGEVKQGNEVVTVPDSKGEDSLYLAPDTLTITLSEPIIKNSNATGDVWNRLYCYEPICGESTCLDINFIDEPVLLDVVDSLQWQGTVARGGITGKSCLRMKADAEYSDVSLNNPGEREVVPTVDQATLSFTDAEVLFPVAGPDASGSYFDNETDTTMFVIPSYNTLPDGNQIIGIGGTCSAADSLTNRNRDAWVIDNKCASVVRLTTNKNEGYIAKVRIYDHLGKFITTFDRQFGSCGELQDNRRLTSDGRIYSYMIWNLRDNSLNMVGNGVYIWKIDYFDLNGGPSNISQDILKQGVARNQFVDPTECQSVVKQILR